MIISRLHISVRFYGDHAQTFLVYTTIPEHTLYILFTKPFFSFSNDFFNDTVNNAYIYCTEASGQK